MPQYILIEIQSKTKSRVIGLTPGARGGISNIRQAWVWVKKNHKKKLNKKCSYHLYPICHGRFWDFKNGKWVIDSWYGDHQKK